VPDAVLDRIETEALESRGERTRSVSAQLGPAERDRISELGGFDQTTTTANWRSAKGVFQREGLSDQFRDAIGSLTDYDDPSEGAEALVEKWTADNTASGGAQDVGEEDVRERQEAARQARQQQANECDHAREHCEHGDSDACEFLTSICGLSDEQVEQILDGTEGDAEKGELPGEVYGALQQLWDQFRAGINDAKRAAAGINEIRQGYGQEPLAVDELGGREITKNDLES
jgi:hypothetical protein